MIKRKKIPLTFLVLSCVLVLIGLSGCKDKQETKNTEPTTINTSKQDEKPPVEKILRFGTGGNFSTFDPKFQVENTSALVIQNLYEGLTKYDSVTKEILPCLATKWEMSSDKLVYTFKLRNDVKFHDGTAFNADAVKTSIEYTASPVEEDKEAEVTYLDGIIKSIEKIDESTIRIGLVEKNVGFLTALSTDLRVFIISPKALKEYGKDIEKNPVGTGQFAFSSWNGSKVILKKYKDYWGEKAKIDTLELNTYNESKQKTQELLDGKLDCVQNVLVEDAQKLESNGMNILKMLSEDTEYFAFNCEKGIFSDIRMRRAISHLIDRKEMVKLIFSDFAVPANSIYPPSVLGYSKLSKPNEEYNLEKAKELINETGKKIPEIKLYFPEYYTQFRLAVEYLKAQLEKIGIKSVVTPLSSDDLLEVIEGNDWDIHMWDISDGTGDPNTFIYNFETKNISEKVNYYRYSNKKYDELAEKGRSIYDNKERAKVYEELDTILLRDLPIIPLYHSIVGSACKPNVTGYELKTDYMVDFSIVDIK